MKNILSIARTYGFTELKNFYKIYDEIFKLDYRPVQVFVLLQYLQRFSEKNFLNADVYINGKISKQSDIVISKDVVDIVYKGFIRYCVTFEKYGKKSVKEKIYVEDKKKGLRILKKNIDFYNTGRLEIVDWDGSLKKKIATIRRPNLTKRYNTVFLPQAVPDFTTDLVNAYKVFNRYFLSVQKQIEENKNI